MRVTGLTQNLQQGRVRNEEETRKQQSLFLQVAVNKRAKNEFNIQILFLQCFAIVGWMKRRASSGL